MDCNNSMLMIEQYKLYVEMADRTSARRFDVSRFYTSLLTAFLVVIPLAYAQGVPPGVRAMLLPAVAVIGVSLCVLWFFHIGSYRQLNRLKFRVIHEMEAQLPFPAYKREWELLGNEPIRYRRLATIERLVPVALLIPYVGLLVYSLLMFLQAP
jgi:hypothetical protein